MNSGVEHAMVGGQTVRVVRIPQAADRPALAVTLGDAGLPIGVPVVALVGGAGGLGAAEAAICMELFAAALVPVVEGAGAILVDGGTDAGVVRLAGRARQRATARFPLVGVAADGTVRWPGHPGVRPDAADLDPNHTHVVAVPGDRWGDEVPWLTAVAGALAGAAPSVTMLANGGTIAYDDVRESLAAGRPVLVLAGTGRTADDIVAARHGRPAGRSAADLAAHPLLITVPPEPAAVRAALHTALSGR